MVGAGTRAALADAATRTCTVISAIIDANSAVPPFEQLRVQFAAAIRAGLLPAGTRLPPIRQLAGDLLLAPNTVARAYRELEADQLVEGKGRRGTLVRAHITDVVPSPLEDAARAYLTEVHRRGLSTDEGAALLRMLD